MNAVTWWLRSTSSAPMTRKRSRARNDWATARWNFGDEYRCSNPDSRGEEVIFFKPVPMPALGGAAAIPLRFLDYLIHEPIRAVLLHGAGVPVLVPSPERYAIHKLIVGSPPEG